MGKDFPIPMLASEFTKPAGAVVDTKLEGVIRAGFNIIVHKIALVFFFARRFFERLFAAVEPPLGLANRRTAASTDIDTIVSEADLTIAKSGPASIVPGTQLVYTITVTQAPKGSCGMRWKGRSVLNGIYWTSLFSLCL